MRTRRGRCSNLKLWCCLPPPSITWCVQEGYRKDRKLPAGPVLLFLFIISRIYAGKGCGTRGLGKALSPGPHLPRMAKKQWQQGMGAAELNWVRQCPSFILVSYEKSIFCIWFNCIWFIIHNFWLPFEPSSTPPHPTSCKQASLMNKNSYSAHDQEHQIL